MLVEGGEELRVKKGMYRQRDVAPGERLDELLQSKPCSRRFDRIRR